MNESERNLLSEKIIGAAIEVHRQLGPGLLESSYQQALICELTIRGLLTRHEVEIPLIYKGIRLATAYRADIIVENEIIIELKATENDSPLYAKQLLTYLKIADKRLGLLINFNNSRLIEGITRIAN